MKAEDIAMKKPAPEDFGLTAEEYEKAINEGFPTLADFPVEKLSEKAQYIVLFLVIGSAFIAGLIAGLTIGVVIWLLIGGVVVWVIICDLVIWCLENRKERCRNKHFRQAEELSRPLREKVENYERAQRDYQLSLEKAQRDCQRRREQYWESLRGVEFEKELARLYSKLGYAVEITKGSGDEGVDLFLRKDEKVIVVQCKGHGKLIGVGAIRDLYGAMIHFEADSAILACPSGFTVGVIKFASDKPIQLISATDIVEMAESIGNC
jgi:hypothetical protein